MTHPAYSVIGAVATVCLVACGAPNEPIGSFVTGTVSQDASSFPPPGTSADLSGQAQDLDVHVEALIAPGGKTVVSFRTFPHAVCLLQEADENQTRVASFEIVSDDRGIVRLSLTHRVESEGEHESSTFVCTDERGRVASHTLDVTVDPNALPKPPAPFDRSGRRTLPILEGDPTSYSRTELLGRGYPPRPDPIKAPAQYERWLRVVKSGATIVDPHLTKRASSSATMRQSDSWSGGIIGNSPSNQAYALVHGDMIVPDSTIHGFLRTGVPAWSFWVGIGGYFDPTPSNLIQLGVEHVDGTFLGIVVYSAQFAWTQWLPTDPVEVQNDDMPAYQGDTLELWTWLGDGSNTGALSQLPAGGRFTSPQSFDSTGVSGPGNTYLTGDINGDGRADKVTILGFPNTGVLASLSDGNRFTSLSWSNQLLGGYGNDYLGDVNGDGFADIVAVSATATTVWLSTGSFDAPGGLVPDGLKGPYVWGPGDPGQYGIQQLADVNGDGRLDLVYFLEGPAANPEAIPVSVSLSTGSGFAPMVQWASGGIDYSSIIPILSYGPPPVTFMMGDVNGDGFADIVGYQQNVTVVGLSNGAGSFSGWQTWMPSAFDVVPGVRLQTYLADVNGDGLADLVGSLGASTYVALSARTAFHLPTIWQATTIGLSAVADINGDGYADAIFFGATDQVMFSDPNSLDLQPGSNQYSTGWFYFYNIDENAVSEYTETENSYSYLFSIPGTSAEWIMEEPSIPTATLLDYGVATMVEAYAEDYSGVVRNMNTDPALNLFILDGNDKLSTAVIDSSGTAIEYTWHAND